MSEFSIEEKANTYDVALKKAKTLLSKCKCDRDRTTMIYRAEDIESIFPELKEFSDKEIKKWLIGYFQEYKSIGIIEEFGNGLKVTDVISWLEKQNDPSIKWNKNTPGNKPSICHSILMKTTHGIAEGEWRGEYWCQYRWSTNHIKDSDVLAWMELSDLDKSFDKIKPKFKIGDWITNGACTWKIDLIEDDLYCSNCDLRFTCGGDIKSIDEQYHLWTIKDAKDGDVLANDKSVFIYAKVLYNKPYAYCGVDKFGVFKDNCLKYDWSNSIDNIHPATKEQRDLLFQKMQEADYTWNAEKKVLEGIKPKFHVGDWIVSTVSGCVYKIIGLSCFEYEIMSDGYKANLHIKIVNDNFNLWTIKDAKNGDILVAENEKPFIFKGLDISHSDKPIAYGGIVDSGYFTPSSNNCTNRWTDGNAYPANKEQCNLLFKKIKEAGYKWNKNKKELKRL